MLPYRTSSNFSCSSGRNKFLEKRIPENPKYNHVKPVVDSGITTKKYITNLKDSQRAKLHKADEIFHRMKLSKLVRLVIEVGKVALEDVLEVGKVALDDVLEDEVDHMNEEAKEQRPITTFESVLIGIGEVDLENEQRNPSSRPASSANNMETDLPYLLLDVRCQDDYNKCHIISALNYPYTMLCRSPGFETNELRQYKNSKYFIIVYDEDESIAVRVASTLVQRGYDNVYLLTGGLKLAYEKFAENLVTGTVPRAWADSQRKKDMFASSSEMGASKNGPRDKFTPQDICNLQELMNIYFNPGDVALRSSSSLSRPRTHDRISLPSTSKHQPWK